VQPAPESPTLTDSSPFSGRLSRHTLLLLVSNLGGAGLSFALSVLIGRALGREGLGVYSVVLAWVFPLSLLADFGLSTLATREIAQTPQNAAHALQLMSAARLGIGGLAALLLMLAAPRLSQDAAVVAGLVVSAPMIVLLPFYSSFTAVFKGLGAMWPIPWLNIGMLAAQVALSLLVLAGGGGVVGLLAVNTLTSLGQVVAAWGLWRQSFAPRVPVAPARFAAAELRAALHRAWPFTLAAVFAVLQMRLGYILIERFTSVDEVAYFAAASRFIEAARLLPNAFFGALFPALAALAATPDALNRAFRRGFGTLALFGMAVIVGAWLLDEPLIQLTYGPDFTSAAVTLRVLAVALLLSLLRGALTLMLYARHKERQVNLINGTALLFQIPLSLWLIPPTGAVGAAIALAITEGYGLLGLWHIYRPIPTIPVLR
jgi:O-antigen/teichoic acid export membrane protein